MASPRLSGRLKIGDCGSVGLLPIRSTLDQDRTFAFDEIASPARRRCFQAIGPGQITGAADDDPSGIATYSQAGARFGFDLLWTMVLTLPLMAAVQLVAARIGRVTGQGLASNMRAVLPHRVVTTLIALLFIANTINIGADLAAMGEAAALVAPVSAHLFTAGFAVLSLLMQLLIPYHLYAELLKYLNLVFWPMWRWSSR